MTTNEGTTALIAEAREHWVELNGLNSRAAEVLLQIADALEAATSEQGSAGDIRRAVHLWSERFIPGDRWDTEDARDLDAALKCVVEANPDRSRARVPVQEEPNDDREALSVAIGGVLFNVMNFPAAAQSRLLGQDMRPLRYTLEDAVLEAGFSRATVPDAATEKLREVEAQRDDLADRLSRYLDDSTGGQLSKPWYPVSVMVDSTREHYEEIAESDHDDHCEKSEALAERDAALAAIERVRGVVGALWIARLKPEGPDSWYAGIVSARAAVLAALDGAPEAEEKP